MNHDQNSGKSAPDASFLVSDLFADGRLGALLSGSYQKRKDELKARPRTAGSSTAALRLRRSTVAPGAKNREQSAG